jgi:chromosome segregation ATPase
VTMPDSVELLQLPEQFAALESHVRRVDQRGLEQNEERRREHEELRGRVDALTVTVTTLGSNVLSVRQDLQSVRQDLHRVAEIARETKQATSEAAAERKSSAEATARHIDSVALSVNKSLDSQRKTIELLQTELKAGRENDDRQNQELATQSEILREMRDAQRAHDALERIRVIARIGTIVGAIALMGLGLALKLDEKLVLAIPGALGVLAYQLLTVRSAKRAGDSVPPPALNK